MLKIEKKKKKQEQQQVVLNGKCWKTLPDFGCPVEDLVVLKMLYFTIRTSFRLNNVRLNTYFDRKQDMSTVLLEQKW